MRISKWWNKNKKSKRRKRGKTKTKRGKTKKDWDRERFKSQKHSRYEFHSVSLLLLLNWIMFEILCLGKQMKFNNGKSSTFSAQTPPDLEFTFWHFSRKDMCTCSVSMYICVRVRIRVLSCPAFPPTRSGLLVSEIMCSLVCGLSTFSF